MTERFYHEHNGQCVCEIHRQFLAIHGETVDQYYERTGREPWYMKTCCREPGCKPNWLDTAEEPQPVTITSTRPAPVQSAPFFVQLEQSGTTAPVQTVLYQEEPTMCNPFTSQSPCNDHCAQQQAAIAVNRKILAVGLAAMVALALMALALLALGPFSLVFAAVLPCVAGFFYVLKHLGDIANAAIDLAGWPVEWLMNRGKREAQQQAYYVAEVGEPVYLPKPSVAPVRLLEMKPIEPIELPAQAAQPVAEPARAARKVRVK